MKRLLLLLVATCVMQFVFSQGIWKNDKMHSRLSFTVLHMGINDITGQFDDFDVTVSATKENFSDAVIEMTARTSSINTSVAKRDEDLRSDNFFNAEKYPQIAFKSTSIKVYGKNKYKLSGNLTIHGITKVVIVNLDYRGTLLHPKSKKITAGLQVTTTIKRSDFKVGMSDPFNQIKDEVTIKADGEFPKQ